MDARPRKSAPRRLYGAGGVTDSGCEYCPVRFAEGGDGVNRPQGQAELTLGSDSRHLRPVALFKSHPEPPIGLNALPRMNQADRRWSSDRPVKYLNEKSPPRVAWRDVPVQTYNERHGTTNAALASTLIRTILESRRALRLAMSMMQELIQTGTVAEFMEESSSKGGRSTEAPKLELHQGAGAFALKRKSTPRTPLRLVSPFRHDSPLVMPGDTKYADVEEPEETPRDRRERDREEEEPRQSNESGAVR